MNSLTRILFIIALILLLFQILMNSIFKLDFGNNSLLYFYSFIALVGFGWFLNMIRKDVSIDYLKRNYKKPLLLILLIIGIIIGIIAVWNLGFGIWDLVIWFYFLFSVLYVFESRVAIAIAILLFGYTLIILLLKDVSLAKVFALYGFYFLITTILTHMREYTTD